MKWLLTLSLLLSFSAFAMTPKEFNKLSLEKRALILGEYKKFLLEYSKTVEITSAKPSNFFEFIESAYAAQYDCLYAGWPSTRVNGLCSTPRSNPAFQRESCGAGQMPCQPFLFGRGVCTPNATKEQKRSAFANCQKRFEEMGRSLRDVVEIVSDPENLNDAADLFELINRICTTGAQASTAMCANLKSRVADIVSAAVPRAFEKRDVVEAERNAVGTRAPDIRRPDAVTVAAESAGNVEALIRDLNDNTRCIACEAIREQTTDEPDTGPDPVETPQVATPGPATAFPRIWSGYDLAACGGSRGSPGGYDIKNLGSCQGNERVDAGYVFRPGPGNQFTNVQTRYPGGSQPGRFWELASRNQAFNETYLVMEEYGGGPDSHNVKSYMFLLPRTTVPSVRTEGNNIIATLPTGETVTMDKTTKEIKSGALTEGAIDLNTDRFQRRPPNINYNGTGISIRLDHRFEHPLTGTATATVKQGSKTCSIPRTAILDDEGRLKTETDAALVAVLNQSCRGGGFRL